MNALSPLRRYRAGLVATVCLLIACGKGDSTPGSASSGASNELLVVGYDREPDTMNRYATHILEDIESCVVEGLVTNDEHMNIVPVLAREIPTVENGGVVVRADGGMDVIWKLRGGVKWHDGVAHTSADVKFTVDAINKGDWKPESVDGFDRIASVDTPDSLTAVVHYREPYAPYRLQFVRGTLPKHVLAGRDLNSANDYNRAPLGTGPYTISEWKTGEYIALERVSNYWRGDSTPVIKRILFKFLTNTTTRINQLKSGEVHMVALVPWDKVRELKPISNLKLNQVLGNGYEHVSLNQRHFAPFRDVRVRQALAMAVDRSLIVHTLLDSLVQVVNGPIQPLSPAYEPAVRTYSYDPTAAGKLLDEAGWKLGSDGVRAKDGVRLSFTLVTQSGFAIRENVSQALQQQLRAVGADVNVQLIDGNDQRSMVYRQL